MFSCCRVNTHYVILLYSVEDTLVSDTGECSICLEDMNKGESNVERGIYTILINYLEHARDMLV